MRPRVGAARSRPRLYGAALLAVLALGSLAPVAAAEPPPLLLISIDGFRWDYLDLFAAPNLEALAERGVRAAALVPVFPTKTFPNHYSAVTGLYPAHHGIVANAMSDPVLGRFSLRDRAAVEDGRWWQGEPIWVTAEKQGIRAATCFWPGSEAEIAGIRPSHWLRYDSDLENAKRVALVFEWLDLPPDQRPGLMTLYFSDVDSAGHRRGPTSEATRQAVAEVDQTIGALLAGLRERNLFETMNILVISDHGMAETPAGQSIVLSDHIDLEGYEISGDTPTLFLRPPAGKEDTAFALLNAAHPRLRAIRSAETPVAWHFRDHPRIPPLIAIADEGWNLRATRPAPDTGGMHGYDPALASMRGVLVGHGPGLARSTTTGAIEIVHLYELMCHLLELDPAPNDGSLAAARPLLATP